MKVIGILGSFKSDGVTRKMIDTVFEGMNNSIDKDVIDLKDYIIKPNSQDLKIIIDKLKKADVWVLAAPTYWGSLSGIMKNFLDCIRQEILRFDKQGNPHPIPEFAHKHYVTLTNCYTSMIENYMVGVTDGAFRTMDKVLTTAGLIKIGEGVQTNTYGLKELSLKKTKQLRKLGDKINRTERKDDQTVKRYIELFLIVAVMAFITMLIQTGILYILNQELGFWSNYISFVIIFFALLAITLHFFTVVKHRRK